MILLLKKFLIKIRPIFITVFFFFIFFLVFLFFDEFFTIKQVKIVNDDKISISIPDLYRKNLVLLSEDSIKKELINKNSIISDVKIEKKYPSTLIIFLEKEIPVAFFLTDNGFFSLSKKGKIITKTKNPNLTLPKINYYQKLNFQSYQPGDFLDYQDIKKTLDLIDSVQELGYKIDTIDISGVDMIVFNLENKKIIFSSEKEKEDQIYKLQQIIKKFRIEGRDFKEIDFRFNKTIIRF